MEYSIATQSTSVDTTVMKFITSFCRLDLTDNEFENVAFLLMELCDNDRLTKDSALGLVRYVSMNAKHSNDAIQASLEVVPLEMLATKKADNLLPKHNSISSASKRN